MRHVIRARVVLGARTRRPRVKYFVNCTESLTLFGILRTLLGRMSETSCSSFVEKGSAETYAVIWLPKSCNVRELFGAFKEFFIYPAFALDTHVSWYALKRDDLL